MSNSWNERDRQRFADRDVLRAQTVPAKEKPVPELDEWQDYPSWDDLFDDDNEIIIDEAIACSLENPETCESCQ